MEKYTQKCDYWSIPACKCGKNEGGIFIPLEDHIVRYCLSANHCRCPQFQATGRPQAEISAKWKNRRRSERINAQEAITLDALNPHSLLIPVSAAIKKFAARTLDISASGMRLFTAVPISQNSVIEFSFGSKFPKQLRRAKGKVQWCNKQVDEPGYQLGIAFAERQVSKAMAGYLRQHSFA